MAVLLLPEELVSAELCLCSTVAQEFRFCRLQHIFFAQFLERWHQKEQENESVLPTCYNRVSACPLQFKEESCSDTAATLIKCDIIVAFQIRKEFDLITEVC